MQSEDIAKAKSEETLELGERRAGAFRRSIETIEIDNLFDQQSFVLKGPLSSMGPVEEPRLLFLYGENGSGKTTTLNLLYHLLSPGEKRGHRTALTQIPLNRFSIYFSDGSLIEMLREQDLLIGPYVVNVSLNGMRRLFAMSCSSEGRLDDEGNEQANALSKFLDEHDFAPVYLTEDRVFKGDSLGYSESGRRIHGVERYLGQKVRHVYRGDEFVTEIVSDDDDVREDVEDTSVRVNRWLQRQLVASTNRGTARASEVYLKVLM